MASRVVILNQGRIEQEGSPAEVYDRPRSLFVNRFIGHTNLLKGRLGARRADGVEVDVAGAGRLVLGQEKELPAGGEVLVSVRPENLRLVADGPIPARIRLVMPLGPVDVIEAELADGTHVKLTEPHVFGARPAVPGDAVRLAITRPEACVLFSSGADAPDAAIQS